MTKSLPPNAYGYTSNAFSFMNWESVPALLLQNRKHVWLGFCHKNRNSSLGVTSARPCVLANKETQFLNSGSLPSTQTLNPRRPTRIPQCVPKASASGDHRNSSSHQTKSPSAPETTRASAGTQDSTRTLKMNDEGDVTMKEISGSSLTQPGASFVLSTGFGQSKATGAFLLHCKWDQHTVPPLTRGKM